MKSFFTRFSTKPSIIFGKYCFKKDNSRNFYLKNAISIALICSLLFVSCRGNEEDLQQVDQIINLYYKDVSGKDLLNTELPGTFTSVRFLDLNGATDQVPINSFSLKKTVDNINYIDYDSGAVRVLKDSLNPQNKTYQSDFIISLTRNIDATTTSTIQDTVKIEYSWTPTLFQISKFYYSKNLVFTKVQGQPNNITIIK
ncbi:hypothetical protein [Halpernia frigidisoli]|uniref:Uncharacterized protein n=1 Tax=Halpernia frigidisoli TaxID=1125876 RepID=A0A1I3I2N2_9FLAO|nr:hypothetical protein [Halpernia frigidisoli]SFI42083.1 hypothetical protein SAMN05443292_2525 [Halpernia frigidisoli]